jgi:chromosome segregation ATPase
MASDYDDLKSSGKLDETIGSLKANLEISKIIASPTQEQYQKLSEKYEEALKLIETLRTKIDELQGSKMPTKDEVESMSAMLGILDKLDIKTLDKLTELGKHGKT